MPRRNLNIIMLAAFLSLICYHRAARTRYASVFAEAINLIQKNYVEPIDQRTLFDAAMKGMMGELDRYSSYIDPETVAAFNAEIDQQFGGVGIEVAMDAKTNRLMITNPLPGTPAYKAGALAGDLIMEVDGQSTDGWELEDAVGVMRGEPGTTVVITVLHEGAETPVDLTIERAIIQIESVVGDTRDRDGAWIYALEENPQIGYIRVMNFGKNTADELASVLEQLQRDGIRGLILDLRGNPGGLLDVAVEMCDMFVDNGVIVSTRKRGGVLQHEYYATERGTIVAHDLPVVLLIDEDSASASEIFAACLQDYERAVVVGERSYGKGTVQNISQLEGGRSELKLTIATYWRPSGKNIHRLSEDRDDESGEWGVRPNPGLKVEMDREQQRKLYRWQRAHSAIPRRNASVDENQANEPRPDPMLIRALEYLQAQIDGKS